MFIATGIIIGLLLSILFFVLVLFLKDPITKYINLGETKISQFSPREKGFVYDPPDLEDMFREEIIEKNKKRGKDTPLTDLYDV